MHVAASQPANLSRGIGVASCDEFRVCPRFVYVIEGQSCTYVGSTSDPERRWQAHQSAARKSSRGHSESWITTAMRRDGIDKYTFRIVHTLTGRRDDAVSLEHQLIWELRADGRTRVINALPRTGYHSAPCFGHQKPFVILGNRARKL
jgi:predicted GIY-YIG superfamily endonuclease